MLLIFSLTCLLIVSVYANYNMLKLNEKMEDRVAELEDSVIHLEGFIQEFSDNLSIIDKQLTEVDSKGSFQADDEVGYTFKTIKLITEKLKSFNINYAKTEKEEE